MDKSKRDKIMFNVLIWGGTFLFATSFLWGMIFNGYLFFISIAAGFLSIIAGLSFAKRSKHITEEDINKLFGKEDKVTKEPSVKFCRYCMSKINYYATRCPHCTSQL